MDRAGVAALLDAVSNGFVTPAEATEALSFLPGVDLGFARLDTHRELRTGLPEVVYGPGKTPEQTVRIVAALLVGTTGPVLVTKASPALAAAVLDAVPSARYDDVARMIVARSRADEDPPRGIVAVVAAGTSDVPIAEEAAVTAEACALKVERIFDVGVAGVHRILAEQNALRAADVCIVVAGMDGALPGVVAGLTPSPIVAVPTSVGYGASFDGLAALLTMLNACAPGVTVVNIDNGFGGAVAASRIIGRPPA